MTFAELINDGMIARQASTIASKGLSRAIPTPAAAAKGNVSVTQ